MPLLVTARPTAVYGAVQPAILSDARPSRQHLVCYAEIVAATDARTCATCELHAEAVFRVEGMDCNEEVIILERRLKPLAGLEAVSADLVGQRLHVSYDAARLSTAAIVDAAGQTGMRIWLEHEEPAIGGADIEWRWRLMVGCAAAISAGLVLSAAVFALIASISIRKSSSGIRGNPAIRMASVPAGTRFIRR